jgi:hypothetical protein
MRHGEGITKCQTMDKPGGRNLSRGTDTRLEEHGVDGRYHGRMPVVTGVYLSRRIRYRRERDLFSGGV